MEKIGTQNSDLLQSLQNDQASLMQKIQHLMTCGEKTAEADRLLGDLQYQLTATTAKIDGMINNVL